jgi:hypothetical protein
MTVVVDASQLPADRRLAAVAEAIEFSAAPFQIVHACPEDEVSTRIEYFTLGENHVVKTESSPLRLTSTRDLIRDSDPDQLFVNLRLTGKATHTNAPGRLLAA